MTLPPSQSVSERATEGSDHGSSPIPIVRVDRLRIRRLSTGDYDPRPPVALRFAPLSPTALSKDGKESLSAVRPSPHPTPEGASHRDGTPIKVPLTLFGVV